MKKQILLFGALLGSSFVLFSLFGKYCFKYHPHFERELEIAEFEHAQRKEMRMDDPVKKAVEKNTHVVVEFYRPGCPFCVYLEPLFDALQDMPENESVEFLKVNISAADNADYYKNEYGFSTVPTIIYFKDGKAMQKHGSENMQVTLNDMQRNVQEILK